jgi:hypothetical protein
MGFKICELLIADCELNCFASAARFGVRRLAAGFAAPSRAAFKLPFADCGLQF